MTTRTTPAYLTMLVAIAASATLAACDQSPPEQTAGERVDATVAQVEQSTENAAAKTEQMATDATNAVVQTSRDAMITAAVNAELAKDPGLSALSIDVDTSEARVELSGEAPSADARDRATQLAQSVEGVKSVDNQLIVATK